MYLNTEEVYNRLVTDLGFNRTALGYERGHSPPVMNRGSGLITLAFGDFWEPSEIFTFRQDGAEIDISHFIQDIDAFHQKYRMPYVDDRFIRWMAQNSREHRGKGEDALLTTAKIETADLYQTIKAIVEHSDIKQP